MQIKTLEREIALIGVEIGCGDNAGTVSLMVQATAMKAQVAALTLALAEAREALKKHGRHRFMCLCSKDRGAKCHCGLDAAHSAAKESRP